MFTEHKAVVDPPFTQDQMLRYRCADVESQIVESGRVLVDCYRKLRQRDTMGRDAAARRYPFVSTIVANKASY